MSDSRYTYEEMEIARFTDLPNLAEAFGYEVQARGRWHFLKDAQHIVIKNRTRYFDNYKQEWGDAITFLEDYADMSFREAMDFLLNYNGYSRDAPAQKPEIRLPKKEENPPVPFALPEPNEDNRRVFSYLRKRGIAYQVIENIVNAGLLYEDKQYHNCVFVGRDAAGEAVFAHKRGTHDKDGVGFKGDVEGSNKDIAFRLPCDPKKTSVHVFEAPIERATGRTAWIPVCYMTPYIKRSARWTSCMKKSCGNPILHRENRLTDPARKSISAMKGSVKDGYGI